MFPLSYFRTMFSPVRVFSQRDGLAYWQQGLVVLFLSALMLSPISLAVWALDGADLGDYLPDIYQVMPVEAVTYLNALDYDPEDQILAIPREAIVTDPDFWLGFTPDSQAALEMGTVDRPSILFSPSSVYLAEVDRPVVRQDYLPDSKLHQVESLDQLKAELSRQWFFSNQAAIRLLTMIQMTVLVLASLLILCLGSMFFLTLMGQREGVDIEGLKEAFTLTLNAFGLPSLLAMLVGFYTHNIPMMLALQSLLYILMLVVSYWRTHFSDAYLADQVTILTDHEGSESNG